MRCSLNERRFRDDDDDGLFRFKAFGLLLLLLFVKLPVDDNELSDMRVIDSVDAG